MAGYTNTTVDALKALTGPALEFLVELQRDCEEALDVAEMNVRASDDASIQELARLRAAHATRAEAIAKARE